MNRVFKNDHFSVPAKGGYEALSAFMVFDKKHV